MTRRTKTLRALSRLSLAALLMVSMHAAPASGQQPANPVTTGTLSAPAASTQAIVQSVVRVGFTVSDLDRAIEFYTKVLSFEKIDEREDAGDALERITGVFGARARTATLRLGDEQIELREFLAPQGRVIAADSRSNDRWFQHIAIVVSDIDRAYSHLRAHHVRHASSGPQTLPKTIPGAAGISAFYFKDPDGHTLEVIHFPQGKGDPRWQLAATANSLFLGIDHTAIVVASTDASLSFYRDALGMHIAGESENFGTEQEHLNNVFGARLRITALRASGGPGIELLEYLAPTDGREYPRDSRACDLWHWETTVECSSVANAQNAGMSAGGRRLSAAPVKVAGGTQAATLRDPDGHVLTLTQPK